MKPFFTYGASAHDRDLVTSTVMHDGKLARYFSSLDAEVFIANERIVDIVRIDFKYEEKKIPIYGFNSFVPTRIFSGGKILTGTFVINFREAGYIANLLNGLDKTQQSFFTNQWDTIGQSCADWNAPLFKTEFDILIGYGGYDVPEEFSYNATYQILRGVHIISYEQILDTSGDPVLEVYSFMARDLSFKKAEIEHIPVGKDDPITPSEGKGKSIKPEDADIIDTKENKESLDANDILISARWTNEETISIAFPQILDKTLPIEISNLKLTLVDALLDLSKTINLEKVSEYTWTKQLDVNDRQKINKKLNSNRPLIAELELEFKINNQIQYINRNIKLYK